jgi:hypothetical protein
MFSREPASGCKSGRADEYGIFKCAVYAVTRPLRNVTRALDAAAPDGWLTGRTATLPTVGLHFRSGWVDYARYWNATACGAYRDVFPDAAGSLPGLRKNETLRESLANLADAADAAFGERRWRVYVAADAPALKSYVARVLGPRCARVGFTTAPLFHSQRPPPPSYSQPRDPKGSRGGFAAADLAVAADFVALAQSDVFLAAGDSSFTAASEVRALCPQRRFAGYGNVAKYSIPHNGPGYRWLVFDILSAIWRPSSRAGRPLAQTDGIPRHFAPDHPCRAAGAAAAGGDKADEAEACQCFLQLALTGAAPSG